MQGDPRFILSSEECELLLAFEKAQSLEKLAHVRGRDISVMSRRLQKLAGKAPVIEKTGSRWRLTLLGAQMNRWTEEALLQQAKTLARRIEIRLGASRMFSAKVLARELPFLTDALKDYALSIVSLDGPLEEYLLNGTVDLAFTCGQPNDPSVNFKRLTREHYVATASHGFMAENATDGEALFNLPTLVFRKLSGIYPFPEVATRCRNVAAVFNDPAALFEATCQGMGWTVLPLFAVKSAPERLGIIRNFETETEDYGVWWVRHRKSLKEVVTTTSQWLKSLEL